MAAKTKRYFAMCAKTVALFVLEVLSVLSPSIVSLNVGRQGNLEKERVGISWWTEGKERLGGGKDGGRGKVEGEGDK